GASYWENVTRSRVGRRRALELAGATGAGIAALGLIGCGSGGSKATVAPTPADKSGLLSKPEDTTAQAKPGGTLRSFLPADAPLGFDVLATNNNATLDVARYTYPRMLKFTPAKYPKDADGASEGDLAETFEISPDKLQITFKLRPGLK